MKKKELKKKNGLVLEKWYQTLKTTKEEAFDKINSAIEKIVSDLKDGTIIEITPISVYINLSDGVSTFEVGSIKVEHVKVSQTKGVKLSIVEYDDVSNIIPIEKVIYKKDLIEIYHRLYLAILMKI